MMRPHPRFMTVCFIALTLASGIASSMTIYLDSRGEELIVPGETWRFLRGTAPASEPADAWTQLDFDDSAWETGPSGFGYGDDDDDTILDDMERNYLTVYIRKTFTLTSAPSDELLELVIDYDDGFIAYLNGVEVARRHMPDGHVTYATRASSSHEAGTAETVSLGDAREMLREGANVLAIEGHNLSTTSSDFSLTPALGISGDSIRNGDTYVVTGQVVTLTGRAPGLGASTVLVAGEAADFNPSDGTWTTVITLKPGLNEISARALNAGGTEVDSGRIEILYVPPTDCIAGDLATDRTLGGACMMEETVTVPAGRTLTILPGTVVLMKSGASIIVTGRLLAEGTETQPILFTRCGDGVSWKQILFIEAADSSFAHCTFEYADSEGDHKDYYGTGLRNYHEAIVALACHLNIEHCTFQNLPDEKNGAEGDAIAIFSDDPERPGEASADIVGCRFLSIGQGVHTRFSYVRVEDCYFTGKRGDNDDVDLWGESTPAPLIRNNVFISPEHDDAINPTRCSARIIGNLIAHTDDHGIVLRDKSSPIVMNNLIVDCANGGIAVENSCSATLINNTIVGCGRGVRLFDLGRWDAPYYLNPGGGTATIVNCIIWDCHQPITLADSANTQIADRGSHVTVSYCDIEGGRDAVGVSGQHSTVAWGAGNIDTDPLFADPAALDFHLQSHFGCWDSNSDAWVRDELTSPCIDAGDPNSAVVFEPFPNGGIINMGAYGNTPEASQSQSGPMSVTIPYTFVPNRGTLVQTGGFAGVHRTYRLKGLFSLTIDFIAGTAAFSNVGASALDEDSDLPVLNPNEIFSLNALTGTIGSDQAITFTGEAPDRSDVVLTATFQGDLIHLIGGTTPPAGSADMFLFSLDAWARKK